MVRILERSERAGEGAGPLHLNLLSLSFSSVKSGGLSRTRRRAAKRFTRSLREGGTAPGQKRVSKRPGRLCGRRRPEAPPVRLGGPWQLQPASSSGAKPSSRSPEVLF